MKLLKVIPITKGLSKELSYFSIKNIKQGTLVSVLLRNRTIPALTIESTDVKESKSKIRLAPYPLKRIKNVKAENFFTPEFIESAKKTAKYFISGTGSVIKELCPQQILEDPPKELPCPSSHTSKNDKKKKYKTLILRASRREQVKFYKNLIRTEFANGCSVFLCVPSIKKIEDYQTELGIGIEKFIFTCHSKLGKKQLKETWAKALEEKHPILIIATGLFLSIPRKDIGTIIIDEEGSPLYKSRNRPFLDIRIAAENLSKENKNTLIFSDEVTRLRTYQREMSKEMRPAVPTSPRLLSRAQTILVDTRPLKNTISPQMKELLESTRQKNQHTLIFINRRGYKLSTVCRGCGQVLSCFKCSTPLVLHRTGKDNKRKFICHKCLSDIDAFERCPYCKSWKLIMLGSGIQKVSEEIKNLFPDFKIFQMDSDTIKNKKQGQALIKDYLDSPGSILLSTEMLFSFYNGGFDNTGVISIDGLFNLPDFSINEKIFRTLMRLKMRTRKNIVIQTRLPEQPLFKNIVGGDMGGFYKSELESRQKFGYPPFKTLIKIAKEGTDKVKTKKEIAGLEQKLANFEPISFNAFVPKVKNKYIFYLLIKLESNTWPHGQAELYKRLSSLPTSFKIEVEPESLL